VVATVVVAVAIAAVAIALTGDNEQLTPSDEPPGPAGRFRSRSVSRRLAPQAVS
jgi:hypothetical protein